MSSSDGRRAGLAMLSQRYHPLFGGAAVQARRLSCELRKRGWSPFVVTARTQGLAFRDEVDGSPLMRVPTFGATRYGWFGLFYWLGSVLPLLIRIRQWSILHVHGAAAFTWFPMWVARLLRRPVVVKMTLMGSDDASELDAGLFGRLNRAVFERADAVVSISTPMSDDYRASGLDPGKLHEMPQGVDTERYRPASESERQGLRQRLGLDQAGPWLVCVGAVFRRKGTDVAIDAFLELSEARPELRLAIVGMDDTTYDPVTLVEEREFSLALKRKLEEAGIADRVAFTGVVDNVEDYMRASDVFVFPSRQEGFGTVMVEAMACGLPCIVNSIEGIAATVYDDGENGLILDEAPPAAWAAAIASLLDDPGWARRLGGAARETAERRYSFSVVCDRYEALYESLLGAGPSGRAPTE